ncbi:hypothetical protein SUDANB121_03583 [Nocardiopsis dassonvillei]|uniref:hypothetical protein n=1 Tax=Nocardiopsis dassonvillei TaxID=2014 RepID=UPI003F56CF00
MERSALEKWVSEGLQGVIERLFALIIHSGGPLPVRGEYAGSPTSPVATVDQGVLHLQNIFSPLVLFLATLGILLAAVRLLWTRRIDPMMDLVRGLLTVIVATFGGLALVYAFVNFGNGLTWMITDSVTFRHDGMERNFMYTAIEVYPSIIRVGSELGDLGFTDNEPARQAVTLLVGLAVMIGLNAQMIVLSLLEAVVYLIACLLPLAAASTLIPGVQIFSKVIGWLFACLLYKPFLLVIYLAGLVILGTDGSSGDDLSRYLLAAGVMLLATGALPVLMKLMSSPALWMMALATGGAGSLLGGGGGGGSGGGGGEGSGSSAGNGAPEGVGGGTMGGPPSPSPQAAAGANERAASLSRNLGEGDGGGTQGGPPSGAADRDALGTQGSAGGGSGGTGALDGGTLGGTGDPGAATADGDPTAAGASDPSGSPGSDTAGTTASGASGTVDSTVTGSEQSHTSATGAADGGDGGGSAPGAADGSSSGGGSYGGDGSYGGSTSDGAVPETGGTSGGTGGAGGNGDPGGPGGAGGAEMPDGVGGGVG